MKKFQDRDKERLEEEITGTMTCFKVRRKVKCEFKNTTIFSEKEIAFLFVIHFAVKYIINP